MEKWFRKCIFGSALVHVGLISIIFLFAGFARKTEDIESFKPITIINLDNVIVTDGPTRGGGSGSLPPMVTPPVSKPVQQQPVQPSPPQQKPGVSGPSPQPVAEEPVIKTEPSSRIKNAKNADDTAEETSPDGKLPPKQRSSGIKISTNLVVRRGASTSNTSSKTAPNSTATSKIAQEFNSAIKNIGAGLTSGGLRMDDVPGFGGGGPAMVNYTQLIMSIFDRAWLPPSEIQDDNLVTEVKIVIHRTGKVTSARITKRSGNAAMDSSVMKALDSVTSVPPFPGESRDLERTFVIEFNLKAKLARG